MHLNRAILIYFNIVKIFEVNPQPKLQGLDFPPALGPRYLYLSKPDGLISAVLIISVRLSDDRRT